MILMVMNTSQISTIAKTHSDKNNLQTKMHSVLAWTKMRTILMILMPAHALAQRTVTVHASAVGNVRNQKIKYPKIKKIISMTQTYLNLTWMTYLQIILANAALVIVMPTKSYQPELSRSALPQIIRTFKSK